MELRRGGKYCRRGGLRLVVLLLKMITALIFFILLCFPSVCSTAVDFISSHGRKTSSGDLQTPPGRRRTLTTTVFDSSMEGNGQDGNSNTDVWAAANRYLGGPGSYPPRCTAKCGSCAPCRAVHVPVPPGTPVIAEYYPEAWRCKCGNRLYMP